MNASSTEHPSTQKQSGHRLRRLALAATLLALLLALGLLALRVVQAATATRSALAELQALQTVDLASMTSLDPAKLADMQGRFARLEADFNTIAEQVGPFLPLTRGLGWLPRFGAEAQAAPELLQLARGVATAGRASMDGAYVLASALNGQPGQGNALARLVPALEQTESSWQEAEAALAQVANARSQLDLTQFDLRIASQLERLDRYLPLLQTGSALARLAPTLLGADGPQTYLVLAQNSDELRPTGGFISGVGLLPIDRGQLGEIDFEDSYTVYNPDVDHPLAPPDLEQTMGAQMLLFRDSNWSADFPTSAQVAQALYQLDTGAATDGVIAFDLEATRRLVAALQPLTLPGYQQPLNGDNVLTAMREVWAEPLTTDNTVQEAGATDWWLHRKDFMGDLAAAARSRLETGPIDFGALAQAIYSSLQGKHVLVTVNNPATAALLTEAGWSGAIDPGADDFLLVVDSNVGWNKVNGVVQRNTNYAVTPRPDGSAWVDLELVYRHQGEASNEPCVHEARYGDTYADMARRCYFNYVRVLAPAGAQLRSAEGFEPAEVSVRAGERGATQFAGNLVLPPGNTARVRLSYELPAGLLDGDVYNLRVQKQPGIPAWPVKVLLVDPTGAWQPVAPGGQRTDEGVQVVFDLSRDVDVVMARQP
ncbi:MAG TPA: DUF4012 domain-containing protein [Anaerolineae bacterium]|nr:DUF4012 domain-containing protein [Anaerolineae bacterium]